MPLHIYKKLFPSITNEQLATTKNKNVPLKTYNKTTITQLGTCTVTVENNNKKKKCRFFVVPRNGQVLLGKDIHSYTSYPTDAHAIHHYGIDCEVSTHLIQLLMFLTVVCLLSGFVWCSTILTKVSDEVAEAHLCNVYAKYAWSMKILSDSRSEFEKVLFATLANELGIEYFHSSPYHPCGNSLRRLSQLSEKRPLQTCESFCQVQVPRGVKPFQ